MSLLTDSGTDDAFSAFDGTLDRSFEELFPPRSKAQQHFRPVPNPRVNAAAAYIEQQLTKLASELSNHLSTLSAFDEFAISRTKDRMRVARAMVVEVADTRFGRGTVDKALDRLGHTRISLS